MPGVDPSACSLMRMDWQFEVMLKGWHEVHHSQQLTIQQLWTAEDKTLGLVINEFTHENEHHALTGVRVKSVNNTSAFVQGETQAALSTADSCPASGKVRPEMVVKSVNEKDVSELGLEALIKVIKKAGRPLRISFLHEHCSARVDESGKTEAQVIADACDFQVPCMHACNFNLAHLQPPGRTLQSHCAADCHAAPGVAEREGRASKRTSSLAGRKRRMASRATGFRRRD